MRIYLCGLVTFVAGWANFTGAYAAPSQPPAVDVETACSALQILNARKFANIPDAPTTINSAKVVPAGGTHGPADDDLPEICRVEGSILPTIGFLVRMPTRTWNGKFMMGGCSGSCGNYLEDRIDPALARNYAVITTDMGHKGSGWIFAYGNRQGQIDFAYRATHLTAVVGKEIVTAFYGRPADRSYFYGCSTGGRQGLMLAQRFPEDFQGIIAGAPVYDQVGATPYFLEWNNLINTGANGKSILTFDKLRIIHRAVMKHCDGNDGVYDGILQNPLSCNFDLGTLKCEPGQNKGNCLTPDQLSVVRKIHEGARDSRGRRLYWGMPWGSEEQWAGLFVSPDGMQRNLAGLSVTGYLAFDDPPGPRYQPADFDYDRDPARLKLTGALYNVLNPDLSDFRKAGGKLIVFHGANDNTVPVGASMSYYETAMKTNGGLAETRAFFRFFMLPAVNHCRGGEGGSEVDWITALENWVENEQPPEEVIAYHRSGPAVTSPRSIEDYGGEYIRLSRFPMQPADYDNARPVAAYPGLAPQPGSGNPGRPLGEKSAPQNAGRPNLISR